MDHSDRFLEGKMGATIDEIIDKVKLFYGGEHND